MYPRSLDAELAREGDSVLHQLSLLASAPADLGIGRDARGRLLSPAGSPVKRPSSRSSRLPNVDGLYPAAATGRCAAACSHARRSCSPSHC